MDFIHHYRSPLGDMTLASDGTALTGVWFDHQKYYGSTLSDTPKQQQLPVFYNTMEWLDQYFRGDIPAFVPQLNIHGTEFRKAVWHILKAIPYGQTMTYKEIASRLATERGLQSMSAQAIGGAVGHNPFALIIPCHRVVGSDGSLTGYAGGIELKERLLQFEQKHIQNS